MKILAIMQNQWFRDPAAVEKVLARHPGKRNEFIKRFLFAGCLSGKRLRETFGDLCDAIVWEEASRNMANHSAGAYAADLAHIQASIDEHKLERYFLYWVSYDRPQPVHPCRPPRGPRL